MLTEAVIKAALTALGSFLLQLLRDRAAAQQQYDSGRAAEAAAIASKAQEKDHEMGDIAANPPDDADTERRLQDHKF
jgi:hypothetical protein